MKEIFTIEDCIPESRYNGDFEGEVIVIADEEYAPQYRDKKYQLHLATGGFGCQHDAIGRAVFTHNLGDGEEVRFNRSQFLGILKPELIPDWAHIELAKMQAKGAQVNVYTKPKDGI